MKRGAAARPDLGDDVPHIGVETISSVVQEWKEVQGQALVAERSGADRWRSRARTCLRRGKKGMDPWF